MKPTKEQAQTYDAVCYAAFATHFKVVLRSKIRVGEEPDAAALRHWNENLPGIATCWHGLVMGVLTNVANAQASGALPPMIETTTAPLPGLGGPPPGLDPSKLPGALASRLAGEMRSRQEAARAASPVPAALDVAPGLAIGRETEAPALQPDPAPDPGYSGDGGSSGGGGASGDY